MKNRRTPKVRLAKPSGKKKRPYQLRYFCPEKKREVRISTGTHDEDEAERLRDELAAKLLLRLPTEPKAREAVRGPEMPWEDFRDEYSRLKVATFRSERAKDSAELRLDVCESIINPRTLGDMAEPETLASLQAELLAGTNSKKGQRSPTTVQSYMKALRASLNWAHKPMRWLPSRCDFELLEVDAGEAAKGRPLTPDEFDRMLNACGKVCKSDPESWKFLLRGLWESGLRLGEAMKVSWDDESCIVPLRTRKRGYLLRIPGHLQKNRKTQEIPTTPQFGALLDEIPEERRTGWIFNPRALRWKDENRRLCIDYVGEIVSRVGKKAGIVVNEAGKFVSAHDLRRSFGQRMADAGLPSRDLQAMMRHASIVTTEKYYLRHRAVEQAERIAGYLGTPEPYEAVEQPQGSQEVSTE